MTKKKVEITLWLHEGEPEGATTWWEGDVFLSVFALKEIVKPEAHAALASAFNDLKDREALFLLSGADPAAEKPLLFLSAGPVADVTRELHGLMAAKASNFDRLVLLGTAGASSLHAYIDGRLRRSGKWNLLNEEPTQAVTADTEIERENLLAIWRRLLKVARIELPGLEEIDNSHQKAECTDAGRVRVASSILYLTGRGADAQAKLEKNGLRILAGSRSSPLDATPSLCQPYRETVKRLVEEQKLKKIDGVWTFVKDVRMLSSVQAASILMRTAAGADNWKTKEGESLTVMWRQ